jgi:hypothetical protein
MLFLNIILMTYFQAFSQEGEVIYEYKKYEKFDFEEISVNAQTGAPGDLTSTFRFQSKFTNELPYRKNFDKEMLEAVDRVR